jgi:cell division protein FtsN
LLGRHGAAAIQEATVSGTPYYRVQAGRYESLREADEARSRFAATGYTGCFVVAIDEKTVNREK